MRDATRLVRLAADDVFAWQPTTLAFVLDTLQIVLLRAVVQQ